MNKYTIATLLLLASVSSSAHAITCEELSQFLMSVAIARNQGATLPRMKDITRQDSSFTASEKGVLVKYLDRSFANPDPAQGAFTPIDKRDCTK